MAHILHITNGDSAVMGMRAGGISGEIVAWRDILHEGPVPAGKSLGELSRIRAEWLERQGFGERNSLEREFHERDDMLRRYTDFDEVILWFEWDLYDQVQLIQILDFLAQDTEADRLETGTALSIVSFAGYLGALEPERFENLLSQRTAITQEMLDLGRMAWSAFTSSDPRQAEKLAASDVAPLEYLGAALSRHLEELPSTHNGLSRSESQILQSVSHEPLSFHEIFKHVANREDRIFCGDTVMARYIERMSLTETPLIIYTSGEKIDAPRTEEDSRAFRNAEMALTAAGRDVVACDSDWITMGGSDRWLGGVHLDGQRARWRWDPDAHRVVEAATAAA
jgi:hypothetical protein